MSHFWRKCSSCKKEIGFKSSYYVCSVSTCNSKRTGYVFCSVPCFERHLPGARHKEAFAYEETSPGKQVVAAAVPRPVTSATSKPAAPQKRIIKRTSSEAPSAHSEKKIPRDILVVASKLKEYIKARSGMNTSGTCMPVLSDILRRVCDDAIDRAREEGRKTVMDRDFQKR